MIIDDSTLIRFINNDLSRSEKNKIQLLINNNPKIKYRVQGLINFRSMLKDFMSVIFILNIFCPIFKSTLL